MLGACKKENNGDESEKLPTCATVRYSEGWGDYTYLEDIQFDEQGRLLRLDGTSTDRKEYYLKYQYSTDRIIATDYYYNTQGGKPVTITYTLDSQNRIIRSANSQNQETTEYRYDSNGYLSEIQAGTSILKHTWSNGNLVKIETSSSTIGITYGNDVFTDRLVAGSVLDYIFEAPYLQNHFGKLPKNAPVTIKRKYSASSVETENIAYIKDAKGNITGYTETENGDTKPYWEYAVDYNCN